MKLKCKCGHWYSPKQLQLHDCTYDYKEEQRRKVRIDNPKITAEKVMKI